MSKLVRVSEDVYDKAMKEAKDHQLQLKFYTEASLQFFISRKLNPINYRLGSEYDLVKALNKAVDRIFSFIVTQEKGVLKNMLMELVRSRILMEIVVDNLHQLSDAERELLIRLRQENERYMVARSKEVLAGYFKNQKSQIINQK